MNDPLDQTFDTLRKALARVSRLSATHADPIFHFVHDAGQTIEIHRRLQRWKSSLATDGWNVRVESFRRILWDVIDGSPRWNDWMEMEATDASLSKDPTALNDSVRDAVMDETETPRSWPGIASALKPIVADATPHRLVLLTDAMVLHPWFRVRVLESALHDCVTAPTVLFYPGSRSGQSGLRFLGFHPEDANYRTTLVGGNR